MLRPRRFHVSPFWFDLLASGGMSLHRTEPCMTRLSYSKLRIMRQRQAPTLSLKPGSSFKCPGRILPEIDIPKSEALRTASHRKRIPKGASPLQRYSGLGNLCPQPPVSASIMLSLSAPGVFGVRGFRCTCLARSVCGAEGIQGSVVLSWLQCCGGMAVPGTL